MYPPHDIKAEETPDSQEYLICQYCNSCRKGTEEVCCDFTQLCQNSKAIPCIGEAPIQNDYDPRMPYPMRRALAELEGEVVTQRSNELQKALRGLEGKFFCPSTFSCHTLFGGHVQTIMAKYKQKVMHLLDGHHIHYYDKREKFVLPDGGCLHLDY